MEEEEEDEDQPYRSLEPPSLAAGSSAQHEMEEVDSDEEVRPPRAEVKQTIAAMERVQHPRALAMETNADDVEDADNQTIATAHSGFNLRRAHEIIERCFKPLAETVRPHRGSAAGSDMGLDDDDDGKWVLTPGSLFPDDRSGSDARQRRVALNPIAQFAMQPSLARLVRIKPMTMLRSASPALQLIYHQLRAAKHQPPTARNLVLPIEDVFKDFRRLARASDERASRMKLYEDAILLWRDLRTWRGMPYIVEPVLSRDTEDDEVKIPDSEFVGMAARYNHELIPLMVKYYGHEVRTSRRVTAIYALARENPQADKAIFALLKAVPLSQMRHKTAFSISIEVLGTHGHLEALVKLGTEPREYRARRASYIARQIFRFDGTLAAQLLARIPFVSEVFFRRRPGSGPGILDRMCKTPEGKAALISDAALGGLLDSMVSAHDLVELVRLGGEEAYNILFRRRDGRPTERLNFVPTSTKARLDTRFKQALGKITLTPFERYEWRKVIPPRTSPFKGIPRPPVLGSIIICDIFNPAISEEAKQIVTVRSIANYILQQFPSSVSREETSAYAFVFTGGMNSVATVILDTWRTHFNARKPCKPSCKKCVAMTTSWFVYVLQSYNEETELEMAEYIDRTLAKNALRTPE